MRFPHLSLLCFLGVLFLLGSEIRGQTNSQEQLAREIRIPRLEFREATVREAIDFLRKKGQEILSPDRMLNINYAGQGELSHARITCLLQNTPILEVLQLIAHQANLTLGVTENGIYLYPPGELPRETKGLREIGWSTQDMKALGTIIYSTGRKDAFSEAQKLIEEVFGDRFKAPKEVRDLLDTIKKRAEEAELRIAESVKQQRSEEPRPSNDSK